MPDFSDDAVSVTSNPLWHSGFNEAAESVDDQLVEWIRNPLFGGPDDGPAPPVTPEVAGARAEAMAHWADPPSGAPAPRVGPREDVSGVAALHKVSGADAETAKTKTDLSSHLLATGRATVGGTGPNEVLHEQGAERVLSGMERGINQNKVNESLLRKAETDHAASVAAAKKAKQPAPAPFDPRAAENANWAALSGGVDPDAVAHAGGVNAYPAHFHGRHGAGQAASNEAGVAAAHNKARAAQMGRVAAGYEPDLQAAAPVVSGAPTAALAHGGDAVSMPSFTKFGGDSGVASGGFSSHAAQLFAIEEGLSAAWNRGANVAPLTVPHEFNTKVEHEISEPSKNPKAPAGTMVKKTATADGTDTGTFDLESSRRSIDVALPNNKKGVSPFEGGFGESFLLDKAAYKGPAMKGGAALTPDLMQQRLDATVATPDQQGAKVIVDQDRRYGGFTVQTAYPQDLPSAGASTTSKVSGQYEGHAPKERRTDLKGEQTWGAATKKLEVKEHPLPAVGGSNLDDEAQLAASLARIPKTTQTP